MLNPIISTKRNAEFIAYLIHEIGSLNELLLNTNIDNDSNVINTFTTLNSTKYLDLKNLTETFINNVLAE